ncbi:MAG TPA: flagellar FleN [Zoogloea sp.]|jgi:flagellar biosynthesis protein FlhG|uniref:MinD/ParA family ATP-binding protein n=1 Tax=Zoogloea sp. TaxID=49181 RepID=UPI002C42AEEC|nr:flagellar FleN [Zoogloea sp.]HOB45056.1 flagellar FleN [Zoogloea sp.]HQA10551.1 flagellar FleN [Zoogloea sp.]HQE39651.1 flagellar FleN [Zoogloea sp.]
MLHASDQAAGLRRLFRRTPSAVVALFASGRSPRALAVQTLVALTEGARRVVAIDEHAAARGSLLAAFGYPDGGDLLGTLQGKLDVSEAMREVADGLWVVPAAAAALAVPLLDDAQHARLEAAIAELQRRCDLLAVLNAGDASSLTPFARAAGRRLLVVEASGVGARGACQWIKGLAAAGAGSLEVAVCGARDRADATALFASLNDFTFRHVGLPLVWRGEVERDPLADAMTTPLGARHPAEGAQAFIRRLRAWSAQAGVTN